MSILPFPEADLFQPAAKAPRGPTIRELVDLYCAHELPTLCANAARQRRKHLACFCGAFGDWDWSCVKKLDLKRWVQTHESWRADSTRKNVLVSVKRLFSWAADEELTDRNPIKGKGASWRESDPRRPMTEDEFRQAIRASDGPFRRVLFFMRFTGCRPGNDVAPLEWSMIDWERGVARLDQHKTRKQTGKPRTIYLTRQALGLLRWIERHRIHEDNDRFVFVNSRGTRWSGTRLSCRFAELRGRLGLPDDCKLYCLRHKFGTDSCIAGNELKTTAELMGHTSSRTTERYYVHLDKHERFLREAAERTRSASGK